MMTKIQILLNFSNGNYFPLERYFSYRLKNSQLKFNFYHNYFIIIIDYPSRNCKIELGNHLCVESLLIYFVVQFQFV